MKQEQQYIPIDDGQCFSMYDLGCAAALSTKNFKLKQINKTNARKSLFMFEYSDEVVDTAQKYWSKELPVDAQTYFNAIKNLKNQIYTL